MLSRIDDIADMFRCPVTGKPLSKHGDEYVTDDGTRCYSVVGGLPILIDFETSILRRDTALAGSMESGVRRRSYRGIAAGVKRLLSPPSKTTDRNVRRLIALVDHIRAARILVIGGGSIGKGLQPIYDHPSLLVSAFDVYASPNVQFIADAHRIPLEDSKFDAVIVQAVLEHVLDPAAVTAEIWRVLKPDGIVYADTPFMQQVHEGAYDFTRFTESGHRYLFRRFEHICSGANGGPGTQFMWAVDYLFRGLFRSRRAGKAAKLLFFWTQYLDALVPEKFAIDGASGVYFIGRKSMSTIEPSSMVTHYRGAQ